MGEKSRYLASKLINTSKGSLYSHHESRDLNSFLEEKDLTIVKGGEVIMEKIKSGVPFCAVRFGKPILASLDNHERIELGLTKTYKDEVRDIMKERGGFYPTSDEHLNEFVETYTKRSPLADILGVEGLPMEEYFAKEYYSHAQYINKHSFEPLLGNWTPILKDKKVLVISPFADDILLQYSRKEKLFISHPEILPEMSLSVLEAPMTMGEETDYRFPSFMRSLEELQDQIRKTDFDIALVGAGCYGSLLSLFIKSLGRSAIETGGATQTLFGLIGKRYENEKEVAQYINSSWIRPSKKPKGYEKVDDGAYW
jgi:hypothetical protein